VKYSAALSYAWNLAAGEAALLKSELIEYHHLLLGIFGLEKAVSEEEKRRLGYNAYRAIKPEYDSLMKLISGYGVNYKTLRRSLRSNIGAGGYEHKNAVVHRSGECKKLFEKIDALAALKSSDPDCIHVLAVIFEGRNGEGLAGSPVAKAFAELKIDIADFAARVMKLNEGASGAARGNISFHRPDNRADSTEPEKVNMGADKIDAVSPEIKNTHFLDKYGRDLTRDARDGKLGPFIGRRSELLQIIQILARRTKNNPVLLGEAGVGKTAIAEALAVRIVEGKDPQVLGGRRVIELNVGSLIAGTKYRGEFEEKLTMILKEAEENPAVILFIDEIHTIVGAGRVEGGGTDAGNILKPALARGAIRCMGSTTMDEYQRFIESDPALERRFDKVIINEPSRDESLDIIKGLKAKFESHHGVVITEDALTASVDLSIRFAPEYNLPDKAIDLLDRACAMANIPELSVMIKRGESGDGGGGDASASFYGGSGGMVDKAHIAEALHKKTGVPLEIIKGHLAGDEKSRIIGLEAYVKENIFGQDEAVARFNERLLTAYGGFAKKRGPLATFLFLGPSGVGKTELARVATRYLFGAEDAAIRFDMSEFMEEHSVSKLIGAPPGYVGFKEGARLTDNLRAKPYSVVLLDEIDKAHPKVIDIFLQAFDEGRITDSRGKTADARNAIFIMTSNLMPEKHMGFGLFGGSKSAAESAAGDLKKYFRVEFLNRIDEIIVFKDLSEDDIRKILKPIMDEVAGMVRERSGAELVFEPGAVKAIIEAGYSRQYGARELRRAFDRAVQVPLSKLSLGGEFAKHKKWAVRSAGSEGVTIVSV